MYAGIFVFFLYTGINITYVFVCMYETVCMNEFRMLCGYSIMRVVYVQNALYFTCYMMLMFNLCNVFVLVFVMRSKSILLWRIAIYKNDLLLLLLW